MTSGIYIVTNKVNGRRYVGYSENIEPRWEDNKNVLNNGNAKSHPLITEDWNKYGENAFSFEVLEVLNTTDAAVLSRRSQYWKRLLNPEYNQPRA